MQTNFRPEQLADPRIAEADAILRRCIHCGLCTAVCPTYVLLGDERDSPRGRIYLIKDMLEGGGKVSTEFKTHVDRCLSCLSCMTTCPSGVDYMHLVDQARIHIARAGKRNPKERFVRRQLARILPYPERFRLALQLAPLGRPWVGLLRRLGLKELAAMIELAPSVLPPAPKYEGPGTAVTEAERRARVILLAGCAQQVLRPSINDATIRLLARRGVDVVVSAGAGCCGALTYHLGEEEAAVAFAKQNVDAWSKELSKGPVDAIIINASGCGTMVKDYGHLLRRDPEYAARAATHLRARARHLRVRRLQVRAGGAQALVLAARRLPSGLLAAARPARRRGAARPPRQGGLQRRRHPRIAHLLRLGRHLQHFAAGARHGAARAQGQEHQAGEARSRRHRQHRLHHAALRPSRRAGRAHGGAAWTGPTAARCRAGSSRSPAS